MKEQIEAVIAALNDVLLGKENQIKLAFACLLARGHLLIEDLPGMGKTLLSHALARTLGLSYNRIQFTSDVLPSDIIGTSVFERDSGTFRFIEGPLFAQLVLADEINRATPKTQSALLEAMQERAITVGGARYALEEPFMVIATQNPIEMEGTYPLPEAQLDRFLFKLTVPYPPLDVLRRIGLQTTGNKQVETRQVMDRRTLLSLQHLVRELAVAPHVADVAARLVLATHPDQEGSPELIKRFVTYGASPRAMQALLLAGRAEAMLSGRAWVDEQDVRRVAPSVLRHRMILAFEAELEGITPDALVLEALKAVPRAKTRQE